MQELPQEIKNELFCTDRNDDTKLSIYHARQDSLGQEQFRNCRGIILDDENNIILRSFPFTEEFNTSSDPEEIAQVLQNVSEDWTVAYSLEGTLLRCFYYQEKWYLATFRKLDAFRSRWGSHKSFGELFVESLLHHFSDRFPDYAHLRYRELDHFQVFNEFCESSLDPKQQYMFLLRHSKWTRLVCYPQQSPDVCSICYLGSFDTDGNYHIYRGEDDLRYFQAPPLLDPVIVSEWQTPEDILQWITEQIDVKDYQGLLFYSKTSNRQVRIYHAEYLEKAALRGNQSNVVLRYLGLRQDRHRSEEAEARFQQFLNLYPDHEKMFSRYEKTIPYLAKDLIFLYQKIFVYRSYTSLPPEEYHFLCTHKPSLESHDTPYIENVLEHLPPYTLMVMLKRKIDRYHRSRAKYFYQNKQDSASSTANVPQPI